VRAATVLALVIAIQPGCAYLMPGDGGFRIAGSLLDAVGTCDLMLLRESGQDTPLEQRKVSGRFESSFVVAPYPADYRIGLHCAGINRVVTTVRYGREIRPGQLVELGEIAL
jgi:hypothetical protein